jgi:hypothetical protein
LLLLAPAPVELFIWIGARQIKQDWPAFDGCHLQPPTIGPDLEIYHETKYNQKMNFFLAQEDAKALFAPELAEGMKPLAARGGLAEPIFAPIRCNGAGRNSWRAAVRPNSKVKLPYEPGYTCHWEMEKRRKETRDWLRKREEQVKRMKTPSIVPETEPDLVTEPEKNDHH